MAVRIIALSKNALVLLRAECGVVVEMRSRELDFARQVHHRCNPLPFRCTRGTHWILPSLPFKLTPDVAAVGGPQDRGIQKGAGNQICGEGRGELAAAQGLEVHGMGDEEKEKPDEDGEPRAMPLEDGQEDEREWAEQQGTFRQNLFVDFRGTPALQLIEILSPPRPHGWKGAVHADTDEALAAAEPDRIAGAFDELREGHILEHFPGNAGMPTDGVVSIAANQDELPVGGGRVILWIIDPIEREVSVEPAINEGDERLFVPGVHHLLG